MTIYILLFMVPLAFYMRNEEFRRDTAFTAFLFAVCVIIGLRAGTVDRDYDGYLNYINQAKDFKDYLGGAGFYNEPAIELIASFITWFLHAGYQWVFLVFAFLGLGIKIEAFRRAGSPYFYASVLIYFANMLFLYEFTQLRVSIAISVFLFALQDVFDRKPAGYFVKILMACLFHYSIVIVLPLYFVYGLLCGDRKSLLIVAGLLLVVIAGSDALFKLLFAAVPRLQYYFNQGTINYYNPLVLMRLGVVALAVAGFKKPGAIDGKTRFYLAVYGLGALVFFGFHRSAGLGLRFSQLLFAIDPLAIPYLLRHYTKGNRIALIIAIAMSLFLANLYLIKIVHPYRIDLTNLL